MPLDPDALAGMVIDTLARALGPVQAELRAAVADVAALKGQVATLDARWNDIAAMRERLAVLEVKAATEQPVPPVVDLTEIREQIKALEARVPVDGRDGRDGLPGVPGAQGEKGADGLNGQDGTAGRDGTLENLKALFDGERTLTFCFKDGTPIDGGVLRFPVPIHREVFIDGKAYEPADMVTWAGSTWLCNQATSSKPGDGSKAWTLCVKRGRDGRDGHDAPGALPVVKVGGR